MQNRTRRMVYSALLVALQVVLSRFLSYNVWNMKIGFAFLPVALSGMLFGAVPAAVVAGVSDVLGAVLFPSGPFFPGFTLTAVLSGLLYGALLHRRRTVPHILTAALGAQWVLGCLLNTLWISVLYHTPYTVTLLGRLPQCALMTAVEIVGLALLVRVAAAMEEAVEL